ncbi:MAG: dihydrodipicolinate synthase family protein [Anaerolineae bacterium]|nr:dihydrodipicolinate synthase family protein [Anaerolineae bacterium]
MAKFGRLQGVMVVLTTPLLEDERIDEAALRQLVRRTVDAGVHAVVALGSAGEFAGLTDGAKRQAIEVTVDEVGGRVPVVVGTGEPGTRRAVEATQRAQGLGADAALVVPPYYYRPDAQAIVRHYRTVAAEGGLPVMLYNIPGFTKVELSLDVVQALAGEPGIAGIKDSSGNLQGFQRFTQTVKSETFSVVTGSDGMLFAQLVAGGDGCISPGSNLAPGWFVALWDAFHAGRWQEAWALQEKIQAMHGGLRYGAFPAAIKGALSLLGIGGRTMASPTAPVSDEQLEAIEAHLRTIGLLGTS